MSTSKGELKVKRGVYTGVIEATNFDGRSPDVLADAGQP